MMPYCFEYSGGLAHKMGLISSPKNGPLEVSIVDHIHLTNEPSLKKQILEEGVKVKLFLEGVPSNTLVFIKKYGTSNDISHRVCLSLFNQCKIPAGLNFEQLEEWLETNFNKMAVAHGHNGLLTQ